MNLAPPALPPAHPPSAAEASASRRGIILSLQIHLLQRVLRALGNPPLAIRLWTGDEIATSTQPITARVRILTPGALGRILINPFVGFGDGYTEGEVEVEGSLVELFVSANRTMALSTPSGFDWLFRKRGPGRRTHSVSQSRDNVHHHYNISNDFYKLWLDEQMVYTCAYFPTPEATLEEAQTAKLDHVCRKLRLKPGEQVVEAGCGWGGLAMHMARHYGVQVKAFNLSAEQIAYAREQAKSNGLADRVEFIEDDYRTITGRHDVFVSVGMLEHVGVEQYPELGRVVDRTLTEHGRGLIHTIGRNCRRPMDPWTEKRIFPGAHPPTLSEMMGIFEPYNFSVLDVENLRQHYARTLSHWLARFEASVDKVRAMFDERFVRMWRLYLSGSQAAFITGDMQLFQVLFNRGLSNEAPVTRDYMYECRG